MARDESHQRQEEEVGGWHLLCDLRDCYWEGMMEDGTDKDREEAGCRVPGAGSFYGGATGLAQLDR